MVAGLSLPGLFLIRSSLWGDDPWVFTLFDDAMISMTYARTLVDTGELVWFPGAPRVQGFTNLLWTLYMGGLHAAGFSGSSAALAVSITSLLCLVACMVVVRSIVRATFQHAPACDSVARLAAGVVPLTYPLVFWSLRGTEVGVLALCALTMVAAGHAGWQPRWSALVSVAAAVSGVLIRLDFAVVVLAVIGAQAWCAHDGRSDRARAALTIAAVAAAVAAVVTWQYWYYGEPLPNTYRLKVDGSSWSDRALYGLYAALTTWPLVVLVVTGAVVVLRSRTAAGLESLVITTATVFLASVAYSVWVGGDAWETSRMANRFVTVGLVCGLLAVVLAWHVLLQQGDAGWRGWPLRIVLFLVCATYAAWSVPFSRMGALLTLVAVVASVSVASRATRPGVSLPALSPGVLVLLVTVTSGWGWADWVQTGGLAVQEDADAARSGVVLERITTPEAVISTVMAGAPAYYARRAMVDFLGKSDRVIAGRRPRGPFRPGHNKWDYQHSVGRLRPDVVFQLWMPSSSDLRMMSGWGYTLRCVPGLPAGRFRRGSEAVRWELLRPCQIR